jgi:hypothetical protein
MLEGKIALVTGGGSGIGKAIALKLAQNGAKVAIASRTLAKVQRAAEERQRAGCQRIAARDAVATTPRTAEHSHERRHPRVLRKVHRWRREKPATEQGWYSGNGPNFEAGHQTESLAPLQAALEGAERPDDSAWVQSMGKAVLETLSSVAVTAPEAEPFDLWATALQLSLAAFSSTSTARSKMQVRRGVDQLNALLKSVITADLHLDPVFRSQVPGHLALLAAA